MILRDVFQGRQFVLDLPLFASYKEKQLLKEKITNNNGIVSYTVTRKTDYVVRTPTGDNTSYRTHIAEKYGVKVVTTEFVNVCLEKGTLVDNKLYLVGGVENAAKNLFADGKIVTAMELKPKCRGTKLSLIKTWLYKDRDGPTFHTDPHAVVKAVVLKGIEKKTGYNFCVIEIHCNLTTENEQDPCLKYCVFTHQGVLPISSNVKEFGIKTCRFMHTSFEAMNVFKQLYKIYSYPPHSMTCCKTFPNQIGFGSDCFRIEDWLLASVLVDDKVAQFVADIWTEAAYVIDSTLSVPLKSIQESQLVQAESLLFDISKALTNNDNDVAHGLSKDYNTIIPHRSQQAINNVSLLIYEYNLCQLIRDLVYLQESVSFSDKNVTEQQYFSLHCDIQVLENGSSEYKEITSLIMEDKHNLKLSICNIFRASRSYENMHFNYSMGNKKLLFHGTKVENIVGILSRGMVLSKIISPQPSNVDYTSVLGTGLYFTDELTAAWKYAFASKTKGRRLALINEVALGDCYDMYSSNQQLTRPPDGFNSVRGVKCQKPDIVSDFEHNEYVVYNINQQRLMYVVEFYQPTHQPLVEQRPPAAQPNALQVDPCRILAEANKKEHIRPTFDIQQFLLKHCNEVPSAAVGLQSKYNEPIPLKSVHIRGKLIDLAAEVVIMQEYRNDTPNTIEARYVFPLEDKAAVCGFEAFSNGQHFIGRIEEKIEAQKEYKEAVESGKRAYLMDEEAPDVFKVSIGNVQPFSTVLVKIRYVAELDMDGDLISFRLAGAVSPWQQELVLEAYLQTSTEVVDVSKDQNISTSVELFVEMPVDIKTLYSPTHPIKTKKTAAHAVVTTDNNASLQCGFQLLIGLSEIHIPRMWVENHPDFNSSACMLTFYPEFVSDTKHNVEVILALDASNSMGGPPFSDAQQIAILCLHYLPPETKFNVLVFGSVYNEAFPNTRTNSVEEIYEAQQFILQSQPTLGGSKISHFVQSYFLLKPPTNTLRNIFIISDGYLLEVDPVLQNAAKHNHHTRIFCFGVGKFVNSHLLNKIARVGAGSYEQFDSKRKSKWASNAQGQIWKAEEPVLTDLRVEWQQFNESKMEVMQAPKQITAVFSGSRLTVYGFVDNCSLAVLKGNVAGTEVSTMVFTTELGKSRGTTLHCLTTKALVQDWENGFLDQDRVFHEVCKRSFQSKIISLSKKYNIITPLTSFVAVEGKDDESAADYYDQPTIEEFVQTECVDFLKYVPFEGESYEKAERMRHRKLCSSAEPQESTSLKSGRCVESLPLDCCLNISKLPCVEEITARNGGDDFMRLDDEEPIVEAQLCFPAMLSKRKYCKWNEAAVEEEEITAVRKMCRKKVFESIIPCDEHPYYEQENEECGSKHGAFQDTSVESSDVSLAPSLTCKQAAFRMDQYKVSSTSLGAGLPICALLLKQLVSDIGLTKLQPIMAQINDMLDIYDDELRIPVFNSCSLAGGVELDNLPHGWNHQLWSAIQSQLKNNGLNSMGTVIHDCILSLIATVAVLLGVCQKINSSLFPVDFTNPSSIEEGVSNIVEHLQGDQFNITTQLYIVKSLLFVTSVNQRHPLVYRSLELGNNWEEAFYLLSLGQNLIDLEQWYVHGVAGY